MEGVYRNIINIGQKGNTAMTNGNVTLAPAFGQNNVPVVVAANNFYAPYAGVFIRSLLDHAGEGNNYDVIILNRDISEENKRLLKSLAAGLTNVSIRFYDPSLFFASLHYADEEHGWPLEVFYKITAPHILNYTGRMIVVDIDTLLKTDIARLMDEDLGGCCVGGVSAAPSIYINCMRNHAYYTCARDRRARDYWVDIFGLEDYTDMESYKDYLGGSMLLYDCEKYLQEADLETILSTAQQKDYIFPEEGVLYTLMKGKIKLLDPAWNAVVPANADKLEVFDQKAELYNKLYNDKEAFQRAYKEPYLLHFASKPKPWVCPDVPYGSEWWQTALRTPFVGHIISRMINELEKRRQYYRERYGKEDVDVWDPIPKGIDRTKK